MRKCRWDARFREKNKGQTSSLYTLVLLERQLIMDDSHCQDYDTDNPVESGPSTEVSQ